MSTPLESAENMRNVVREGYARIAETGESCCGPKTSCCDASAQHALSEQVGYDASDLSALPEGADMGLSCGNPTAIAALQEGETILDLGSGGGLDVFIAGRKVGPAGRVIGVDMTPEMIAKARRNIATYREHTGWDNVEFRLGEIEHLPVADNSVDAVISNCVINLSPDKPQVWREIARVLRPGGRVAVSDLALKQPLPPEIAGMVEALVGCIAGAVLIEETKRMVKEAGLEIVGVQANDHHIDAMLDVNDPFYREVMKALPTVMHASDFVTSLDINAMKPEKN
ncbi:MAG TPA: arsenite methyltransferase [Candidatus Hydrogenedentes bacterium]|nr:arsenite methyltransferase [Candidatus Hydrogenedentota bacterium]